MIKKLQTILIISSLLAFSMQAQDTFSFIKVAQPTDLFGNPSFLLSVRTTDGVGIEPIDSLQTLFDGAHDCSGVGIGDNTSFDSHFSIFPNPAHEFLEVQNKAYGSYRLEMLDLIGHVVRKSQLNNQLQINISTLPRGLYFVRISNDSQTWVSKLVIN